MRWLVVILLLVSGCGGTEGEGANGSNGAANGDGRDECSQLCAEGNALALTCSRSEVDCTSLCGPGWSPVINLDECLAAFDVATCQDFPLIKEPGCIPLDDALDGAPDDLPQSCLDLVPWCGSVDSIAEARICLSVVTAELREGADRGELCQALLDSFDPPPLSCETATMDVALDDPNGFSTGLGQTLGGLFVVSGSILELYPSPSESASIVVREPSGRPVQVNTFEWYDDNGFGLNVEDTGADAYDVELTIGCGTAEVRVVPIRV